jgi:hypothetical protein
MTGVRVGSPAFFFPLRTLLKKGAKRRFHLRSTLGPLEEGGRLGRWGEGEGCNAGARAAVVHYYVLVRSAKSRDFS